MTDIVNALNLPTEALVNRRVPKALLIKHGAATAAQRRLIRDQLEEIRWLAALKPTTVGVRDLRDSVHEYIELAVVAVQIRTSNHADRLHKLVHRAIPYPVLLVDSNRQYQQISLAHKRKSKRDPLTIIIEGELIVATLSASTNRSILRPFYSAITLSKLPKDTLYSVYQAWIDATRSLLSAQITGKFSMPDSVAQANDRAQRLEAYQTIQSRLLRLTNAVRKETQIARRAALNIEINRLRTETEAIIKRL